MASTFKQDMVREKFVAHATDIKIVVDATSDLIGTVKPEDMVGARACSYYDCLMALAATRVAAMMGIITGHAHLTPKGVLHILDPKTGTAMRWIADAATVRMIKRNDKGFPGESVGKNFRFYAPTGDRRLGVYHGPKNTPHRVYPPLKRNKSHDQRAAQHAAQKRRQDIAKGLIKPIN
jgi:hypothetical protein